MGQDFSANVYVLHRRPWRETSVLLDLFSLEHGRMQMSARAVKTRERATWNALLQPFVPLTLHYAKTKGWPQLRDAESNGVALALSSEAGLCALYCNELLMRLFALDDAHPLVFQHYQQVLSTLAATGADAQMLAASLRQFEWSLLMELGSACDLSCDRFGADIEPDKFYRLQDSGLQCVAFPVEQDFSGSELMAMSDEQWSACAPAAKRLLRQLLGPLIGSAPLNSRELWRERTALRAQVRES